MVHEEILSEISQQQLPKSYANLVERYLIPLAEKIAVLKAHTNGALLVGVQGGQGTGKSTLALFMSIVLQHYHHLSSVSLSLDDFYLTQSERGRLADEVHPLLKTRGVPGTHDIKLALHAISALKALKVGEHVRVPRFDKASDDRKPESEWEPISGKVDVILFEGWCVAARPEDDVLLDDPINTLEAEHDPLGLWRHWVNEQLKSDYQVLFNQLDYLIVLQAPSFDVIYEWRRLQEHKLKASIGGVSGSHCGVMDDDQVAHFIQHYERITRNCLKTLPALADCLFKLDKHHTIFDMVEPKKNNSIIVVSDLDGTLLDHFDYSFSAALPALASLKQRGIPLIINTSKTYTEVVGVKAELAVDTPCIVENGSAIYLPISNWPTLAEGLSDDLLLIGDQYVKVMGEPRAKILTILQGIKHQNDYLFDGFSDFTPESLALLTGLSQDAANQALNRHFSEPILWHDSEERYLNFVAEVEQYGLMLLRGGRFIHVLGRCNKGQSLAWLKGLYCEQNGLNTAPRVVALGDSQNDSAMLLMADIAVVIKSPVHEFPDIIQPKGDVRYSTQEGPRGWNEEILRIIEGI